MSKTKRVVSLSEFKAGAARLIESMYVSGEEIILTQNGSATAVTMKLLVQGEADIKTGRLTLQSRQFADLKERLAPASQVRRWWT